MCDSITVQMPYHKPKSIGTVSKNVQVKIIDVETGNTLGSNKTGELLAKSLIMTKGYYKNPQANKDAIDADGKRKNKTKEKYDQLKKNSFNLIIHHKQQDGFILVISPITMRKAKFSLLID